MTNQVKCFHLTQFIKYPEKFGRILVIEKMCIPPDVDYLSINQIGFIELHCSTYYPVGYLIFFVKFGALGYFS